MIDSLKKKLVKLFVILLGINVFYVIWMIVVAALAELPLSKYGVPSLKELHPFDHFYGIFFEAGSIILGIHLVFKGFSGIRRKWQMKFIPLSRLRAAAIGMCKVAGVARQKAALKSPFLKADCVYYSYVIETIIEKHWVPVSRGSSAGSFYIEDTTGRILINPAGAEVHMGRKDQKTEVTQHGSKTRYTEHIIQPGDYVYAYGRVKILKDTSGEDIALAEGCEDEQFIISTSDESAVERSLNVKSVFAIAFGNAMILIMAVSLAARSGLLSSAVMVPWQILYTTKNASVDSFDSLPAGVDGREIALQRELKDKIPEARFQYQAIAGKYSVKFLCREKKLIVDLDEFYENTIAFNKQHKIVNVVNHREQYMRSLGFDVIKYSVNELQEDRQGIVQKVKARLRDKGVMG